jgi:hypothetical protein
MLTILTAYRPCNGNGITVNLLSEDWSNGMKDSENYVYFLMDALKNRKH